ncbi:MAG: substrate-binding domain-containing protein, partial [Prevotella sp.]|nr:substrate-binding domain-containing protein [Prevotella sp.]
MIRRFIFLGVCAMMVACSEKKPNYIIGVSQCSEDIWRNWQNAELRMEANFHEGVELRFAAAHDNSERQIQQIDSLVESGIQLLIMAPNQLSSVSPAIDRAYDKGIPVI